MKLLLENWRKYLKEDIGYFGKKFVDFKKEVDKGTHPLLAAQLHLEYIGKGSTRKVFGFQDNPSQLIKVINVDLDAGKEIYDSDWANPFTGFTRKHKTVSNENEADLMMQQKYPNVFPRTYEVADDYSWILAERVSPLTDEELAKELGIPEDMTDRKDPQSRELYKVLLEIIMNKIRARPAINEVEATFKLPDTDSDDTVVMPGMQTPQDSPPSPAPERSERGYNYRQLKEMADTVLSKHRKLFEAVVNLEIPPREIVAKNLGISEIGGRHLVILDASLWELDNYNSTN